MTSLDGRVALVTGAARGQGRAHALTLAADGADLAVCDIGTDVATVPYSLGTKAELDETAKLVEAQGRRCLSMTVDVRDTDAVEDAVARTVAELGSLDICVANAGICGFAPFWELTDEMWRDMTDVNLGGTFRTLRAAVRPMIEQGRGRMVATASMAAKSALPNLAHYTATKWGVIGMVKSLALEVAKHGITVNAVAPSTVDTAMVHNPAMYGLFSPGLTDADREQVRPAYERMNPMGSPWLDPAEIAAAVRYLVSDDAAHISGTTLEIAAGSSAHIP